MDPRAKRQLHLTLGRTDKQLRVQLLRKQEESELEATLLHVEMNPQTKSFNLH